MLNSPQLALLLALILSGCAADVSMVTEATDKNGWTFDVAKVFDGEPVPNFVVPRALTNGETIRGTLTADRYPAYVLHVAGEGPQTLAAQLTLDAETQVTGAQASRYGTLPAYRVTYHLFRHDPSAAGDPANAWDLIASDALARDPFEWRVAPATYLVVVEPDEWLAAQPYVSYGFDAYTTTAWGSEEGAVTIRVLRASTETDARGIPIPDDAKPVCGLLCSVGSAEAVTDADGLCHLESLFPGDYEMKFGPGASGRTYPTHHRFPTDVVSIVGDGITLYREVVLPPSVEGGGCE